MSAPLKVAVCAACDYVAYPPRLLCPRCGSGRWADHPAGGGEVKRLTTVLSVTAPRRTPPRDWLDLPSPRLAEVLADVGGVRVVARVPEEVIVGERVVLEVRDGVVVAVPDPEDEGLT